MRNTLIIIDPQTEDDSRAHALLKILGDRPGTRHQLAASADALADLSGYELVVLASPLTSLSSAQEEDLCHWVKAGGGLLAIHAAAEISNASTGYLEMIGMQCVQRGPTAEFNVNICDGRHEMTRNFCEFRVTEQVLTLQRKTESDLHWLLANNWRGQMHPVAYVREYGGGRVFYTALGYDARTVASPAFQWLIRRAAAWTTRSIRRGPIRYGIVGYGGSFSMGKAHTEMIRNIAGLELTAICEVEPRRLEIAAKDHPDLQTFATVKEMAAVGVVDVATVVTPHNTHASIAMELLEAGIGVVCEKPFCLNVSDADGLIDFARNKNLLLTVFHNRRWDPDFLTIRQIIARGLLGDVFQIEAYKGEYKHPGYWWRSDKRISGGAMYDWGAHYIDWILHLMPQRIESVMGYFSKRLWQDVTNEDHCKLIIRFEDACLAEFEMSHLTAVGKPKWRILGTHGGLTAGWDPPIRVTSHVHGLAEKIELPHADSRGSAEFYIGLTDHLLADDRIPVTPESARRVIAVMETAEKSNVDQKPVAVPHE